jgi:hypothetical protein
VERSGTLGHPTPIIPRPNGANGDHTHPFSSALSGHRGRCVARSPGFHPLPLRGNVTSWMKVVIAGFDIGSPRGCLLGTPEALKRIAPGCEATPGLGTHGVTCPGRGCGLPDLRTPPGCGYTIDTPSPGCVLRTTRGYRLQRLRRTNLRDRPPPPGGGTRPSNMKLPLPQPPDVVCCVDGVADEVTRLAQVWRLGTGIWQLGTLLRPHEAELCGAIARCGGGTRAG